jgi:hypothetical protein
MELLIARIELNSTLVTIKEGNWQHNILELVVVGWPYIKESKVTVIPKIW